MTARDYEKFKQLTNLFNHAMDDVWSISGNMAEIDNILMNEVVYHIQAAVSLLDEIKARNDR